MERAPKRSNDATKGGQSRSQKNYDDDELDHTYEGRTFSIVTSSERLRISKKDKNNLSIKNEANKPKFSAKSRTAEYERAINLLNNTFSDFSLKRSDVLYFDVSSELNINSDEMFIDYCCHLSGKDAELMAKKLTEFIKKNI